MLAIAKRLHACADAELDKAYATRHFRSPNSAGRAHLIKHSVFKAIAIEIEQELSSNGSSDRQTDEG